MRGYQTPHYEVNALSMGIVWELVHFPISLNIIKVILWVYQLQAIEHLFMLTA